LNRRDLEHYRQFLPNVRLIPNPVAASVRSEQRERLVLAVGHLEPLKQFEHAIRAMAQSGLEDDGWSLAIVGSGSTEAQLRELIERLGLKRTKIHPPAHDLDAWYARASLLLLTSRLESFSLVLAEAMLAGVVPVAYASDGPSFILEDFPEQLVELGDVKSLAQRLVYFADGRDLEPLRQELAASVRERFSPDVVAGLWEELLSRPGGKEQ
jgi:glycosyltransferase involved in cell wall biosynthesis